MTCDLRGRLGLVLLLVLLGGVASAQPVPEDPRRAEATRLAVEGSDRLQRGDPQAALERFQQAYGLYPSPKLHYNLGLALLSLGRDLEAARAFGRFLLEATSAPPDTRRFASEKLAELDRRLARLEITGDVTGAAVRVDGDAVGVAPLSARVWPGAHHVEVTADGRRAFHADLQVSAGERRALAASLPPIALAPAVETPPRASAAPAPTAPVARRRPLWRRWWFWGVVGGAVIGVAAAAIVSGGDDPAASDTELGAFRPDFRE